MCPLWTGGRVWWKNWRTGCSTKASRRRSRQGTDSGWRWPGGPRGHAVATSGWPTRVAASPVPCSSRNSPACWRNRDSHPDRRRRLPGRRRACRFRRGGRRVRRGRHRAHRRRGTRPCPRAGAGPDPARRLPAGRVRHRRAARAADRHDRAVRGDRQCVGGRRDPGGRVELPDQAVHHEAARRTAQVVRALPQPDRRGPSTRPGRRRPRLSRAARPGPVSGAERPVDGDFTARFGTAAQGGTATVGGGGRRGAWHGARDGSALPDRARRVRRGSHAPALRRDRPSGARVRLVRLSYRYRATMLFASEAKGCTRRSTGFIVDAGGVDVLGRSSRGVSSVVIGAGFAWGCVCVGVVVWAGTGTYTVTAGGCGWGAGCAGGTTFRSLAASVAAAGRAWTDAASSDLVPNIPAPASPPPTQPSATSSTAAPPPSHRRARRRITTDFGR